jgi:hypothetical protein
VQDKQDDSTLIKTQNSTELTSERALRKALIDRALSKMVSRKLLVWSIATFALFRGLVPPEQWMQICIMYIGSEAATNLLINYIRAKNAR